MNNLFNRLLKTTTNNTYIQLFRYLFAGLVAFLADLATLYFLTDFAGVYYLISAAIGFLVGLTITYLFSVLWIFDERRTQNKFVEVTIFALIGLVGLMLTSFFMWLFTSILLFHYLYSKIITTVIVFIWNFIAKKKILFTKKKS